MKQKEGDVMHQDCVIICAGEVPALPDPGGSFVICADGGLRHAERCGVRADLILGDFDSYGRVPEGEDVLVYPAEKDETDSFLAVRQGMVRGFTRFLIYGALGGRLDHSVTNLHLLHFLCEHGCRGTLVGADGTRVTAIKNETRTFDAALTGYFSVFSLTDESRGVTIKNFKYEAENLTLDNRTSLTTSNEFIGKPGSVTVEDGVLLLIWKEDLT